MHYQSLGCRAPLGPAEEAYSVPQTTSWIKGWAVEKGERNEGRGGWCSGGMVWERVEEGKGCRERLEGGRVRTKVQGRGRLEGIMHF